MTVEEIVKEASVRRGWPPDKAHKVVYEFLRRRWPPVDLFLGFRAGFRCEYCGLDLLSSVDAYKLWEKDHIARRGGADPGNPENLALACLVCNFKLKGRWMPTAWPAERTERLKIVREYLSSQRLRVETEIATFRQLLEQ